MSTFIYRFHSLIRRNLSLFERLLTAGGLAALIYVLIQSLPVYPMYWDIVIVVAVFLLTLWSPVAGYFFTVLAACYPLYTVSIYIAVLFLAVAVLGQHVFIQNLGATLITLASPLLGGIYIAWIIPVMGGAWWGPAGGALMGAFAALWGMLFAGMAGLSPDWLNLLGILPDLRYFSAHFSRADSFETLSLLVAPFFPNTTILLYYLLQIASWALVGWVVGMLTGKEWFQYHRPRATLGLVALAVPVLAIFHILFALWLGVPISLAVWDALMPSILYTALGAVVLEASAYFFEHPVPLPKSSAIHLEVDRTPRSSPAPMPVTKLPPMETDDQSDDLIMLELD